MWPFAKKDGCMVCEQKNSFIQTLLSKIEKPCVGCDNYAAQVAYLEELLDKERQDRKEERAEFKRAVDRVLEVVGSRPVGQGVQQAAPQQQITTKDLFGIFNEEPEQERVK